MTERERWLAWWRDTLRYLLGRDVADVVAASHFCDGQCSKVSQPRDIVGPDNAVILT